MQKLLAINVNEHTEKKNGLTYLSWAWAWAKVLELDPSATWVVHTYGPQGSEQPYMSIGKTAMVHTSVTINGVRRECMLPVMDHRNKAIQDPDAFAVNTAIMRCMTKAISMHGLGLYIYAGEDLPQVEAEETEQQRAERQKEEARRAELDEFALFLIDCHEHEKDMDAVRAWYDSDAWSEDVGEKQEEQKYVWGLLNKHSKLRSTIKANHPDRLKEAA